MREAHSRHATDMQMLDRLAAGFVQLPHETYDLILILSDADGTAAESSRFLTSPVMFSSTNALKKGGHLRSQDGTFGSGPEKTNAIMAGLVEQKGAGFMKPD